jgi:hypothetical protein
MALTSQGACKAAAIVALPSQKPSVKPGWLQAMTEVTTVSKSHGMTDGAWQLRPDASEAPPAVAAQDRIWER